MSLDAAATWELIGSLTPWDKNPRRNDQAVAQVARSIERFGFGAPIIARTADRVVIAGHTRHKLGELAEWDDDAVASILRDLEAQGSPIDELGWSSEEIDALLAGAQEMQPESEDEAAEVDEQGEPDSKPGVVYELGPHRLVCGDSTKPETWASVLRGEKLQAIWTDPPYGVSYVGKTKDALTIKNDELDLADLGVFLGLAFDAMVGAAEPGAPVYVAGPSGPRGVPFANELLRRSLFRQRLAWVKSAMVLGYSDYHYKHEDIYFGYVPGAGRRGRGSDGWFGDNAQTTVLEFDKPSRNGEHPTMKPVPLVEYCLGNSTEVGWIVGEPFGGSGTTLIACAQTGRVARLIELDPRYCDVIRRRWTRWAIANNQDPGPGALGEPDEEEP